MPTNTNSICSNIEWIKLIIDNKFIFYNSKSELIAYHPPFPIQNLAEFLQFYHFSITPEEFISYLNGIIPPLTKANENINKEIKHNEIQHQVQIDTSPLTCEKELKDLIALCKNESIDKVLNRICNVKFKMMPSYEYDVIDKKKFKCNLKIQNKIMYTSDIQESKSKARNDVDMKTVKSIVPSIFNELISIEEDKKNKKMQKYQQYKAKTLMRNNNYNMHNYSGYNSNEQNMSCRYLNKKRTFVNNTPSPQFSVELRNDEDSVIESSSLNFSDS